MGRGAFIFSLAASVFIGAFGLSACGSDKETAGATADPCPEGICASGSGGASSSSSASGSGGTTGTSGCVESWLCAPWDTGGNGDMATRACTDMNACGTTANKPVETATLPALDLGYFKCNVEPILDAKCSMVGCHGTETGRAFRVYSRARLRHAGETLTDSALCAGQSTSASCSGSDSCPCTAKHTDVEWQKNYDSARGFLLDAQGKPIPSGMEDTSDLIAQAVVGGKAHAGFHLFKKGDADYTTISTWLTSAGMSTPCDPAPN